MSKIIVERRFGYLMLMKIHFSHNDTIGVSDVQKSSDRKMKRLWCIYLLERRRCCSNTKRSFCVGCLYEKCTMELESHFLYERWRTDKRFDSYFDSICSKVSNNSPTKTRITWCWYKINIGHIRTIFFFSHALLKCIQKKYRDWMSFISIYNIRFLCA